MKKKRKNPLLHALSMALGFVCALVLGALFYGAMVYQLSGEEGQAAHNLASPAPLIDGQSAESLFPGPLLTLEGELLDETVTDEPCGRSVCRVVTRTYALTDGVTATAVSVCGAAILTLLADEGFVPQLITGFSLAGLDAVCEQKDGRSILAARSGDCVYLLEAQADEPTLYALGAGAVLR